MNHQPASANQPESILTVTSIMPRGDKTMVAGDLRGPMPSAGDRLLLTTPQGVQTAIVSDVTTLAAALQAAARAGAEVVSTASSGPIRCALVLDGVNPESLAVGDRVILGTERREESDAESDTLQSLLYKDLDSFAGDTFRLRVNAVSVEEVERELREAHLPAGWKVWKTRMVSGGKKRRVEGRGESPEIALATARQNLPPGVTVCDEKVEHHSAKDPFQVQAFTEEGAREQAQAAAKWTDITNIRVKSPGRTGFLGIGRRPNIYEVSFREQARAEITYEEKPTIEIVTINTAKVSDRECSARDPECENPAVYRVLFSHRPLVSEQWQRTSEIHLCKAHAKGFFAGALRKPPSIYVSRIEDLVSGQSWLGSTDEDSFMRQKIAEWQQG